MPATETEINVLLEKLEMLLSEVKALSAAIDRIATMLEQAEREYELKLGDVMAEADRLDAEKHGLLSRLNRAEAPGPMPPRAVEPVAPPALVEVASPAIKLPPSLPENPTRKRKRALADFIFNFNDSGPVIEKINALVDDDARDIGEMLELMEWGQIWKERTSWETFDEQRQRLEEWHIALEERRSFLTEKKNRLEENSLWNRRSKSEEDWQSFLDEMLQQRKAENERAAREIEKLEQQWKSGLAERLETNDG